MVNFAIENNVESLIINNPLLAGGTILSLSSGTGVLFPSEFPYRLTIWDESTYSDPSDDSNMEIVECISKSGDMLTIARGKEGTSGVSHAQGSRVAMLITAGLFNDANYGILPRLGGKQSFTNLLPNGNFESWSAGTGAAPDGWTLFHATIQRSTAHVIDSYGAEVTYTGGFANVHHSIDDYLRYAGRTMSFGCWVKCDQADTAQIRIHDSVSGFYSDYHTGSNDWEWLTITATISTTPTFIQIGCLLRQSGTATFDGAILVEGSTCPAFSPKPLADVEIGMREFVEDPSTQSFMNLLSNGNFESWSDGILSAPDGWTVDGGADIARSTDEKIDTYSALLTYNAATATIYQDVDDFPRYTNRVVTFGAWVKSSTASNARLWISDGVTNVYSAFHTGSSVWEWITVSMTVDNSPTRIRCLFRVDSVEANIDGAILVEGSTCPAFSPKPIANDGVMLQNHTPAAAGADGVAGQWAYDANYIYVCVATNTWKRVAISSW